MALSLDGLVIERAEAIFDLKTLFKSNRTDPLSSLHVNSFWKDQRLCVVSALRTYISLTRTLRASQQLLVSYIKPHKAITRNTLARWTIRMLKMVGVNTNKYASCSTHGEMASKARLLGIYEKKRYLLRQ